MDRADHENTVNTCNGKQKILQRENIFVDDPHLIAPCITLAFSPEKNMVVYHGQTLITESSHIVILSITIPLANANRGSIPAPPFAITTAGLTFTLGPGAAIIPSSPGKCPQPQRLASNPKGPDFARTTIPIPTPLTYLVIPEGIFYCTLELPQKANENPSTVFRAINAYPCDESNLCTSPSPSTRDPSPEYLRHSN